MFLTVAQRFRAVSLFGCLRSAARKGVIHTLIAALICMPMSTAWAQQPSPPPDSAPPAPPSSGIVTKICEPPPICFASKEARLKYAKDHDCQFLEDVCDKAPASDDNKGAKPGDKGFWAGLWDDVSGAVKYGYEFGKGLFTGLKDQITDLIDLISSPMEVAKGLVELGKAFYDDPKGTLVKLGELLGQEAVDTITRATQCGAYDLGKVIGSYVSPAVMLKVAARLGKASGKLADVIKDIKKLEGCASFIAGTLVQTPMGMVPIERITAGDLVLSRHDTRWTDQAQRVDETFGRVAGGYRELVTELETVHLTDEHPLWVQGKGWTAAKDVTEDDVLSSQQGDVLVLANVAIPKSVRVFNFSVAQTPNYFVGHSGLWAHNAKTKCQITHRDTPFDQLDKAEKGFRGEVEVFEKLTAKGVDYKPVGDSFNPARPGEFDRWNGQKGIDGIYQKPDGTYVLIESKATGGIKNADPAGCVDKLCNTGSGRQMSRDYIKERLDNDKSLTDKQREDIMKGLDNGKTERVYAQTDAKGTTYHEIVDKLDGDGKPLPKSVEIGKVWTGP